MIVLLASLNLATVKLFGEMEFWFAMIKIVAIVALIITGDCAGQPALPFAEREPCGADQSLG